MRPTFHPAQGWAGLAVALAFALAGCSEGARPIARVGATTLTTEDYLAAAAGASQQYPGPAEPARNMLIDDLVRRRLLMLGAEARGMMRDTLAVNFRRLKEEEFLVRDLSRALAPAEIPVSEDELRAFYTLRDSSARVQIVYAFTSQASQAALQQIEAGVDFGAVADHYNPANMIPPRGDLGEVLAGNLVAPLDDLVRSAPIGRVIGPIEAPGQGWFLILVTSRQPHPQEPFESQRAMLAELLRQRKSRAAAVRNHQLLRKAYSVERLPGAGQVLFQHFNFVPDNPTPPTEAELAQPLVRWEDPNGRHDYTFRDALADLDVGGRDKPDPQVLPAIEQWLEIQVVRRVQVVEARRRGMDATPTFRRELDEAVNNYVLEGYYNDEVMDKVRPDPDDARRAYQRDAARFEKLDSVDLQVVDFPDSASAFAFSQHAGHGGDLRAAAAMVPGAPPVRDVSVSFPSRDPAWGALEPTLAAMPQGDAIGPFPWAPGWRSIQLIARHAHVPPFEALDAGARGLLDQEGGELARERRLVELLEELRRQRPVVLVTENIRRLPWPVPAPPAR